MQRIQQRRSGNRPSDSAAVHRRGQGPRGHRYDLDYESDYPHRADLPYSRRSTTGRAPRSSTAAANAGFADDHTYCCHHDRRPSRAQIRSHHGHHCHSNCLTYSSCSCSACARIRSRDLPRSQHTRNRFRTPEASMTENDDTSDAYDDDDMTNDSDVCSEDMQDQDIEKETHRNTAQPESRRARLGPHQSAPLFRDITIVSPPTSQPTASNDGGSRSSDSSPGGAMRLHFSSAQPIQLRPYASYPTPSHSASQDQTLPTILRQGSGQVVAGNFISGVPQTLVIRSNVNEFISPTLIYTLAAHQPVCMMTSPPTTVNPRSSEQQTIPFTAEPFFPNAFKTVPQQMQVPRQQGEFQQVAGGTILGPRFGNSSTESNVHSQATTTLNRSINLPPDAEISVASAPLPNDELGQHAPYNTQSPNPQVMANSGPSSAAALGQCTAHEAAFSATGRQGDCGNAEDGILQQPHQLPGQLHRQHTVTTSSPSCSSSQSSGSSVPDLSMPESDTPNSSSTDREVAVAGSDGPSDAWFRAAFGITTHLVEHPWVQELSSNDWALLSVSGASMSTAPPSVDLADPPLQTCAAADPLATQHVFESESTITSHPHNTSSESSNDLFAMDSDPGAASSVVQPDNNLAPQNTTTDATTHPMVPRLGRPSVPGSRIRHKPRRRPNKPLHLAQSSNRPYSCDECGAAFSRRAELRRHISTRHSDERPFGCDVCGKAYGRSDALKRHKQREDCSPPDDQDAAC